MKVRQSISQKMAIGFLAILFAAGLALPDLFAAGLGSGGKTGGSSSPSSSMGKGAGSPIISEKSSPTQSGAPSSPAGSGQSSTTPLSTSTDSQTSYKTYTQPDSGETPTSYEGSVGSEATAAGSKKKKAGGGGFPPADTITVTAAEGDTAMAIRGKPAHSEEHPTKGGSDVAGGGSSDESRGPDLERIGGDIVRQAERALNANVYVPDLPETMQSGHLIKEGQRSIVEPVDDAISKTGKNLGDVIEKAGHDTINEAGRVPGNIEKGVKFGGDLLQYDIDQLREGNIGALAPVLPPIRPGHLIEEGRRSFGNTPLGRGLKEAGDTFERGTKQLGDAGKKVGGAIGKASKEVGDAAGQAGAAAGDAADTASDWVSSTAQQGQDTAEDAGSSTAEQVCDWFGC